MPTAPTGLSVLPSPTDPASDAPRLPALVELGADLLVTTRARRLVTLGLPFLAMAAYVAFALMGWWPAAVLAVMALSFVTYGSTSHDLVHRNLGFPRRLNDLLLSIIEGLSLRSGTAYRRSHLHHHRRFPHRDDLEGGAAHGSLWGSLLAGPALQARLFAWAWRRSSADRPRLAAEAAWIVGFAAAAAASAPWTPVLWVYALLVIGGSWVFPLITVYLPHDARGAGRLFQTRLFRGPVTVLSMQHLYHLEHHLYPAVPHHHWRKLATRLDPIFAARGVRPARLRR